MSELQPSTNTEILLARILEELRELRRHLQPRDLQPAEKPESSPAPAPAKEAKDAIQQRQQRRKRPNRDGVQ